MNESDAPKSFGVFKPVGHVLASFPDEGAAKAALAGLDGAGVTPQDRHYFPAAEVKERSASDIENASPLASLGQDLNLVKAHHELATKGHPFVAAKATDDDHAKAIAAVFAKHGADRAQHYGRFIVEELIEPGSGERQVFESPSRGLDSQTPSGKEEARDGDK